MYLFTTGMNNISYKNDELAFLKLFLSDLTTENPDTKALYSKYFFINKPGEPDRSPEEIKYYTDTLFKELNVALRSNAYEILPLSKARKKYKSENLYDYYYDGQKNSIYVIVIKMKGENDFVYTLMYLGKILSMEPSEILDNGIIGWR